MVHGRFADLRSFGIRSTAMFISDTLHQFLEITHRLPSALALLPQLCPQCSALLLRNSLESLALAGLPDSLVERHEPRRTL